MVVSSLATFSLTTTTTVLLDILVECISKCSSHACHCNSDANEKAVMAYGEDGEDENSEEGKDDHKEEDGREEGGDDRTWIGRWRP